MDSHYQEQAAHLALDRQPLNSPDLDIPLTLVGMSGGGPGELEIDVRTYESQASMRAVLDATLETQVEGATVTITLRTDMTIDVRTGS